jgi:hypothetical protein
MTTLSRSIQSHYAYQLTYDCCADCRYAECHYADGHNAYCRYAEGHYADGHNADGHNAEGHCAEYRGSLKFKLHKLFIIYRYRPIPGNRKSLEMEIPKVCIIKLFTSAITHIL